MCNIEQRNQDTRHGPRIQEETREWHESSCSADGAAAAAAAGVGVDVDDGDAGDGDSLWTGLRPGFVTGTDGGYGAQRTTRV